MGLTKAFEEAVTSGDVRSVRIMMKDSLLMDPSFEQFKEMEKAASSLQGLYEVHDGRDFQDKSTWDDNYMNKLMVQVVNNFSKQRVNHLKEVVEYLRPVSKESSYQQQKSHDQKESTCQMKKSGSLLTSRQNSHKKQSSYQQQKSHDQKESNCRMEKQGSLPISHQNSHKKESSYHQTRARDQQEGNCRMKKTADSPTSYQNSHKKESSYHQTRARDQQEGNCRMEKIKKGSIGGAAVGATSGGIGAALARYTIEAGGTAASSVVGGAAAGAVIGGVVVLCIVLGIANNYNKNKED